MGVVNVQRHGYRSLFWPIVLIAVGVVWLLGNLGIISGTNIVVLLRLWPLLLIIIGLDLLFGRQSPIIGALIGIGAVILIIVLMLIGPSIGLAGQSLEVKTDSFSEAREDATSAEVILDLGVAESSINALTDGSDLFQADLRYVGDVSFDTEGTTRKTIRLQAEEQEDVGFFRGLDFLGMSFNADNELRWDVRLSPDVPLLLTINSGVGDSVFDLSALEIEGLDINSGVGALDLRLPRMESAYNVNISSGVGEMTVSIAEDSALTLNLSGGVGQMNLDLPEGVAARIQAQSGLGNVELPAMFERVGGDDDNFLGDEGTWQTANYAEAERRIDISFSGGIGGLAIR